jgi:hypothetical protein
MTPEFLAVFSFHLKNGGAALQNVRSVQSELLNSQLSKPQAECAFKYVISHTPIHNSSHPHNLAIEWVARPFRILEVAGPNLGAQTEQVGSSGNSTDLHSVGDGFEYWLGSRVF